MNLPFSKVYGCLIGLAIGDALGSATEEMNPASIRRKFGNVRDFLSKNVAGTDDTEYAMLTAMILVENNGVLDYRRVGQGWLKHLGREKEFVRGGASEWEALQNLKKGIMPPKSGSTGSATWSDGAAMRIAPIGVFCAGNPSRAAKLAEIDACVSNANEGVHCAQALAASISEAFVSRDARTIIDTGIDFLPKGSAAHEFVTSVVRASEEYDSPRASLTGLYRLRSSISTWYAPEALGYAYAMFGLGKGSYVESVLGAVNLGRDADTIAAMTGAMCGALGGADVIPGDWIRKCRKVKGTCIREFEGIDIREVATKIKVLQTLMNH
jgi:ADP-ribosylglycohydrolase